MTKKLFKRKSLQRDVILRELKKMKSHPTATDLYNVVRQELPNISLGTVYRNLDQLSQKGIIQKLEVSNTEARFDGDLHNHYHIVCTDCGRVDDIKELPYENKGVEIAKIINGYKVTGYHMNFHGICLSCLEHEVK